SPSSLHFIHTFLLHIPPPPISTLFPYTTLFRSPERAVPAHLCLQPAARRRPGQHAVPAEGVPVPLRGGLDLLKDRPSGVESTASDRKSTRLNSSHVAISYAVFCLKKKKKKWLVC